MQAVIMAGGKGTRLQSVAVDIPKPMVPILDKPILEYQIENLKASGIREIILVIGHLGEEIQSYFSDGSRWDVNIDYIIEDTPLGTAGALYYIKGRILDDFILVFGDVMLSVDWKRFMDFHKSKQAFITLYGHPNMHPYDSDIIVKDIQGKVLSIKPKNMQRNFYYHNFVNAGIYCVNPKILEDITDVQKVDLEKQIIADQIRKGTVYAYKSTEYIKDMGTPDRLNTVTKDVKNGIVDSKCLKNKQKAIFLDRNSIIDFGGFLKRKENFQVLSNAAVAIRVINTSRYLGIVTVKQQSFEAGGYMPDEEQVNMRMETKLGESGVYIDDLFYDSQLSYKRYSDEIFVQAARKYNITLSQSWYLSSCEADIQIAKAIGVKTILLFTDGIKKDAKYKIKTDYVAKDLLEAVQLILKNTEAGG